jgi:hypothetical protein
MDISSIKAKPSNGGTELVLLLIFSIPMPRNGGYP